MPGQTPWYRGSLSRRRRMDHLGRCRVSHPQTWGGDVGAMTRRRLSAGLVDDWPGAPRRQTDQALRSAVRSRVPAGASRAMCRGSGRNDAKYTPTACPGVVLAIANAKPGAIAAQARRNPQSIGLPATTPRRYSAYKSSCSMRRYLPRPPPTGHQQLDVVQARPATAPRRNRRCPCRRHLDRALHPCGRDTRVACRCGRVHRVRWRPRRPRRRGVQSVRSTARSCTGAGVSLRDDRRRP